MDSSEDADAVLRLSQRRRLLSALWALTSIGMAAGSSTLAACGGASPSPEPVAGPVPPPPAPPPPAPPPPVPPPPAPPPPAPPPPPPPPPAPAPGAPSLGAHSLVFHRDGVSASPLTTAAMATRGAGSTLLACVGRGVVSTHRAPTDNMANTFVQLGTTHVYTLWTSSGTALYACEQSRGGSGHVVTVAKPQATDETTLSVVEIAAGGVVRDVQWREVLAGQPLTSPSVTTTGAALIVAWWWGDAGVQSDKTAEPDSGFTVVDSILQQGALVQCAAAVRQVSSAGSYQVTWTSTPLQGAQLWIAAIQSSA